MRAFNIHLNQRLGPEGTDYYVARNALHRIWINSLASGELPNQTVVKTELLDFPFTNAISSTVSYVADPSAFGAKNKGGGGGAHAFEFAILLAAGVDAGIGFDESFAQGAGRAGLRVFGKSVRDDADGQFTGQLADGMRAHPISHQKNVASGAPLMFIPSQQNGVVVLIVAATDPYIAEARMLD